MAFNLQTFKTRTGTAVIFAAVMLFGLLWNPWTFFLLLSVIHFGCWVEYQKLIKQIYPVYREASAMHRYGIMLAGWCLLLLFSNKGYQLLGIPLHELGWWLALILIFLLPLSELLFTSNIVLKNIGFSLAGLIYISLSWGLMMNLYNSYDIHIQNSFFITGEKYIPAAIVAAIWINDTMAYIVGSLIGRNKLSEISPGKTWEGTIGGILLSVMVVGLLSFYVFDFGLLTIHFAVIAAIASITGTFGDLLESKLKRMAGVKDSGAILPGHGGFLDRFDSLLLAIPFVWIYVKLFMK
jgi:phosphatidate cytidylyltransferase